MESGIISSEPMIRARSTSLPEPSATTATNDLVRIMDVTLRCC